MTIEIRKRHWIVFAILLALQATGAFITAGRGSMQLRDGWIYLGLIAVPNLFIGWVAAVEFFTLAGLGTSVVIVSLWENVFRAKPSR